MTRGKVLITGARGQDGSYLTEMLAADGFEIVGIDKPARVAEAGTDACLPGVQHRAIDLLDAAAVRELVSELRPTRVFHLASASFVPASWNDPTATSRFTVESTINLLEAIRECDSETRFLGAASAEIFGHPDQAPQNEATPVRPVTPYGAAKAEFEYLYDNPYEDKKKVRVAGPLTVESLSPHRVLGVDDNDELIDPLQSDTLAADAENTFTQTILENLKTAGVQQAHKDDRVMFTALNPWPGELVCGEARYLEGDGEKRAAIFIGPEFGTVQRTDLVAAAREAGDAGFDTLIACAFNYEAHTTEFNKLGSIPVLSQTQVEDVREI